MKQHVVWRHFASFGFPLKQILWSIRCLRLFTQEIKNRQQNCPFFIWLLTTKRKIFKIHIFQLSFFMCMQIWLCATVQDGAKTSTWEIKNTVKQNLNTFKMQNWIFNLKWHNFFYKISSSPKQKFLRYFFSTFSDLNEIL